VSKQRRLKTSKLQNSSVTENWDFFSGSDCKQVCISCEDSQPILNTKICPQKMRILLRCEAPPPLPGLAANVSLKDCGEEEEEGKAARESFSHTQHSAHVHIFASLV
jgi:hypothetical protein